MTHPAAKILRNIQTERFHRVFDDWLEAMLLAHCADRSNPDCPHEAAYMKLVKHYGPREQGNPHAFDHFKDAMWTVMGRMQEENKRKEIRDHLGEIYEEEGRNNSHMGQYFTPMHLCQMMVGLTTDKGRQSSEHEAINDPACGSGRFFLASLPMFKLDLVTFYGTDKDRTCANMAALNMLWRNANSYIVWGNSLSVEAYGGWATAHTALGGAVRQMNKDQAQTILESGLRQIAQNTQQIVPTIAAHEVRAIVKKSRDMKPTQYELEL